MAAAAKAAASPELPETIDLTATDDGEIQTANNGSPIAQPTTAGVRKGGHTTAVAKEGRRKLAQFVVNEQATAALRKLGKTVGPAADPRQTLLDTVASAWRQQQVWEQMLAAIPDEDWQFVGMTPVPGSQMSAKGARIEAIQKYLGEATKSAARISKLAIDAGIEERLVRLAEEQSAMIADTVKAGIMSAVRILVATMHLSAEQAQALTDDALASAAQQLRLLAAGVPAGQPDPSTTVLEGEAVAVHRTFDD